MNSQIKSKKQKNYAKNICMMDNKNVYSINAQVVLEI